MRGHKWKMLGAAMQRPEVTSREFATATGLPSAQCAPYAHSLENDGYLRLVREVPPERGGRPLKVYAWTGKQPTDNASDFEPDSMWGKADAVLLGCFNRMVRCREDGDGALECAV